MVDVEQIWQKVSSPLCIGVGECGTCYIIYEQSNASFNPIFMFICNIDIHGVL
jgi:hypothetical protein